MRGRRTTGLETLLVGIDAACRTVLEPLFAAGAVPNLASVFEAGASGELTSQVPPWTPSAWPSIYTGVNPGKHGVFGFLTFDGYDWDIVNSTSVREPTLWELLDHHGLSSVVVNAPVTHPAPAIDDAIVPGYVAPENPDCHPDGVLDDVREAIGEYRIYPQTLNDSVSDDEQVAEHLALTRSRGEAFRYLCERFEPEFGFLQFQQTDTVLHEFPGDRAKVRRVYEAVDEQVGAIVEEHQPENVIVVSDHGMGAYDRRFRVNDYLRERGYVETAQGGVGMPTWAKIRDRNLVSGETGSSRDRDPIEYVMEAAANVGFTSQRIGAVLDRLGVADQVMQLVPDDAIRAASEQVDFANSAAYVRSRIECGVRLNLEGREPDGVVPLEEYERVRSELVSVLEEATTPNGDPVFEDVAPREQYFHGPHADAAVDIVTVPNDFRYYLTSWLLGDEFEDPPGPAWDHHLEGVVAASGAGIDAAAGVGDARLFDVAPTVLATFGLPISDWMDGSTLPFVEETESQRYPETAEPAEATSDGDVEAQLSDLGYIE